MSEEKQSHFAGEEASLEALAAKQDCDLSIDDIEELKHLKMLQSQMADFLIERFQNNLETFKKYMPDVAKTFETYRPKRTMEFFCAQNGIPNLIFPDTNDILYKTFDPFELCKKQVDFVLNKNNIRQVKYPHEWDPFGQIHFKFQNQAINIEESVERDRTISPKEIGSLPNVVLIGIGLGYQLANLYENIEIANLLIVEPDLDMFYASMHSFDWKNLLEFLFENKYGVHIMLGQTPDQFYLDMESYYATHGRFLASTWLGYLHYSNEKTKLLCELFEKHFNSLFNSLGFFDDHLFGTSHACQAILDKKAWVKRNPPMKKNFENAPVFIIGSGPSLDHDIQFLRKYQDKAIIIACGTAIDTLYHAGIKPDIYACTERTAEIKEALSVIPDPHFYDDIILMAGDVIHPNTTSVFKHTAIFGKLDEPTYFYFTAYLPETRNIQHVQLMNPLVGNMGVSGSIYLGFRNLYLFGLDNGKKIGSTAIHSKYTTLYKNHGTSDTGGNYTTDLVVPGNFGGQCGCGFYFNMSRRNIGFVIQMEKLNHPSLTCHNCSDGAVIDNTTPIHSEDLEEEFSKRANLNKETFFKFMTEEKTTVLNYSHDQIKEIFSNDFFKETCEKIKKLIESRPDTRLGVVQLFESISEICAFLRENPATYYYGNCLQGTLQSLFITGTRVLYHQRDEKMCIELANKVLDLIVDFLNEAPTLFDKLPDYVMSKHRDFYPDGKVGQSFPDCPAPNLPPPFKLIHKEYDDPQKVFEKRYE